MKTHTSSFKEQIKLIGKEIDSRITFGSTVLGKNDLNAVTPSYQGAILKSVMKQLDIDSNVEIPVGTILKYEFGLKVNGEYEYINYGNYVVYSVEKQEDTKSYKIVCYDKLLYSMLDYVKLPITYPISIRDYINTISTTLGLKFANKSGTFANYNKQIQADLYDGLGYTFRDILDELAQVTASTICLNNNDELEIRYITETGDTIDEEFLKDVNVNFGEKFGAVNTIVLSRSADSDSVYYPSVLPTNPYEIKISDNQIMNGNDRADFLPDIYNKLNGLEFYTNDFVSTGICYYDLCDRYSVKVGDNTYSCVMFNDEVLVTQGLEENVYTELPEQTETDYKHASKDDRMINQVYIIAKKNEAEILALVSTTETIQKEIKPTKDESGSNITIEDASNNPLTYLEIEGKSTQETRSGKNLIDLYGLVDTTINGIDVTYNGDGTITLNGTATILTYLNFPSIALEDATYSIGIKYAHETIRLAFRLSSQNVAIIAQERGKAEKENTSISGYNGQRAFMFVEILKGATFNNFTIFPMIVKASTLGEYEQYGVSPSPEFPSEIESVGYENIFDKDNYLTIDGFINASTYAIQNATNSQKSAYIKVKPNTKYYISDFNFNAAIVVGAFTDIPKIGDITTNYVIKSTTMTDLMITTGDNDKYLVFMISNATTTTDTSKMQIVKGSKKKAYIPYGKYGIEVETVGKNMLPNDLTTQTKNGITVTINEDKSITFNGITSAYTEIILSDNLDIKLKKGIKYILSTHKEGTISGGNSYFNIISSDKTELYVYNNNASVNSIIPSTDINIIKSNIIFGAGCVLTNFTIYPMLEENQDMTKYQPYQKNTSLIVLNEPLRNLPNRVKDIAYIRNNKLYVDRYVGSVVLDGSENWQSNQTTDTDIRFHSAILSEKPKTSNVGLSNRFKVQAENNRLGVSLYSGSNTIYIWLPKTIATTTEEFKEWLSTHNTQVDYELATPVIEELGEIEMLKTLKGYNNISTADELLPIINLTYVRDTIIADYVENHVAELKLTENEIKASVESVSSSVDGLNTTINRVEEITNDNSQVINVISTNIDTSTGEVREVTTTTGFTFNADGMTIDDGSGFKAQHRSNGTYYKDGNSIVGQYTKDGSKQKDLELFGTYSYGKESIDDTPMFIGQLYTNENGEQAFGHFYNGEG